MAGLTHPVEAVFFDVDGTLMSFTDHQVRQSTIDSLYALKARGIRVCVATGRSKSIMKPIEDLFPFDACITINGQFCYTHEGDILRKVIIGEDNINRLKALKPHYPCLFVTEAESYVTFVNDDVTGLYQLVGAGTPRVVPLEDVDPNEVVQFAPFISTDDPALGVLRRTIENVDISQSFPYCLDVVPTGGGKQAGVEAVLRHFGIDSAHTLAFGDGRNDIGMLRYVATGVAMGRAPDDVKAVAKIVAPDTDDDGIFRVLRDLGLV